MSAGESKPLPTLAAVSFAHLSFGQLSFVFVIKSGSL